MGTGTIIDIALYAGCGACALEAVAAYARLARARDGHKDAGSWHAPLIFTSAAFALLGILGVLSPASAAVLAALPLAAVAAIVWRAWRAAARALGWAKATAIVLGGLAGRVREALGHTREDLRDLRGKLSREGAPADPAAPGDGGRRSAGGAPRLGAVTRARHVPPLMDDPYLGAHPYPADVAASLELDRVPVPPHWDRTAQVISDFDPEDDDDTQGHVAGEAAGVLTVAAAVENRAEHLALAVGLDPAIIEAHYDIAEGFAELATRYALLVRRDHLVMGDLREYRDQGGVIPHDGRRYMDAGDPRPDGGQAA
jgi:hypothetical protein